MTRFLVCLVVLVQTAIAALTPEKLRTAYREKPLCLDAAQPRVGCALLQGRVEASREKRVVEVLVAATAKNHSHLYLRFLGSKYVPNALAAHGRADLAHAMTERPSSPSYAAGLRLLSGDNGRAFVEVASGTSVFSVH